MAQKGWQEMQDESFKEQFEEHLSKINRTLVSQDLNQSISDSVINALDYFRVGIKYLIFDLEATRRENKFLRRLLEEIRKEEAGQIDDLESDEDDTDHFDK
tara:strand:+ start:127 stop:429 length:303 start_codon:yes stop_codon:yes gene_type:complete